MKNGLGRIAFLGVFLLVAGVLAADAYAEKTKIRVVVEKASIRLRPDLQGEIIKTPPIGSIFEAERKEGEWYEVKIQTEVGVMIAGYIHEMFVETVSWEAPPPELPKKPEQAPAKGEEPSKITPPSAGRTESSKARAKRFEIVFRAGYMSGTSTESSAYSDSFSGGVLDAANVSGTITTELTKPWGFDGALNIFLVKGVGIQLKFDYASSSKITDASKSTYDLDWRWNNGSSYDTQDEWAVGGDVSLYILSGNLIFKIPAGRFIAPVISGGLSYFSGSAKVDTSVGYATTWTSQGYRFIDYFVIPAMVDTSLGGVGFNAGAGIDFVFSPSVALNIEGRYFYKGQVQANWTLQPGEYPSTIDDGWTLTLDQGDVDEIATAISPFSLNPSFFKISGGIKFMF
jgi:hypothetical protein